MQCLGKGYVMSNNDSQTFLWRMRFKGRKVGSSEGIFYEIETIAKGKTTDEALLSLYDKYEHISNVRFDEPTISH